MSPTRPLAAITGASRGIGLAIAEHLAPTHDLLLIARDPERLAAARDHLGDAVRGTFTADLAAAPALTALIAALGRASSDLERPITALINNAGAATSAPLARSDDGLFDRMLALNARAPYLLTRALVPAMVAAGGGRVITIASTAALKGYAYTSAYAASKAAVVGWTRALAVELARSGITVNAICPGFTATDLTREAIATIQTTTSRSAEEASDALARFSPLRRLLEPAEVAALAAFLASPAAAAINGQALAIDGGETA